MVYQFIDKATEEMKQFLYITKLIKWHSQDWTLVVCWLITPVSLYQSTVSFHKAAKRILQESQRTI